MENLIENALHYTPENGHITIDISLTDDVIVTIRDTGPGISTHALAHIFERFYHSDRTKKDREGHSGLGLAITHKIIELHQKQLCVSTEPGKETCFTFALPVNHSV